MAQRSVRWWLAVAALAVATSVLSGACVGMKQSKDAPAKADRGIKFSHALHGEQGMGCTDCHAPEGRAATMPNHDNCGTCHEINMDEPDEKACAMCHTDPGFEIKPRVTFLREEVKFSHEAHAAKEVDCSVCHPNPDQKVLPTSALKAFCMDCHGKTEPKLNECSVCHSEISKDTIPQFRGKTRILHDAPAIWENVHGQESRVNPAYCALCHDSQDSCQDCHSKNAPKSHTVAFKRHTHGMKATFNRESCAACHEEDSCRQCHKDTAPRSHRGTWGGAVNSHCVQCHFPPEETNCTVCHEEIEHRSAMPSPHGLGIYPPRCGVCHPGGVPYRAPHALNTTVRCSVCH